MTSWRPRSRPATRRDIEATLVQGELVLWDPRLERVHRLDPVATLLWPFLDGEATIAELAADAAEVWGTGPDEARTALVALVEQLDQAALLDTAEAPEPPVGGDEILIIANPQRCGTDLSRWSWCDPAVVEVAGTLLSFRVSDETVDNALRAALAGHIVDADIPVNYSLAIAEAPGDLTLLFWGHCTVARTRSLAGALTALLAHLAGHQPSPPGVIRLDGHLLATATNGVAFFANDRPTLWKSAARLRRSGAEIVPSPWVDVIAASGTVAFDPSPLVVDLDPLLAVADDGTVAVPAPWKRQLTGICVPSWMPVEPSSALATSLVEQGLLVDPAVGLPLLPGLLDQVPVLHALEGDGSTGVAGAVAACLDVPLRL